jgi:pimeloyl-ACP methyl ester carboxylesterase
MDTEMTSYANLLGLANTKEKQMARFVLVHGGFSGAWIWLPLMDRLKAAGHVVEAFDLPGMGDDNTSASEVSLDSYAGRVCEVLAASSEPGIVVGHSMGGIVATQAAARCPERVAALVYVAAFLPKDGQSLLDLTKLPEGDGEQVLANVVVEGEPPVAVMPAAASRHALYRSCAEDVATWAIARQCPQPVSPLPMAVSIPPGALNGINRYYVLCTRDRAIPPPLQRRMIAENACADVIELDTDHTPQLSMTNELAKALHQFATHSSASAGKARRSERLCSL